MDVAFLLTVTADMVIRLTNIPVGVVHRRGGQHDDEVEPLPPEVEQQGAQQQHGEKE